MEEKGHAGLSVHSSAVGSAPDKSHRLPCKSTWDAEKNNTSSERKPLVAVDWLQQLSAKATENFLSPRPIEPIEFHNMDRNSFRSSLREDSVPDPGTLGNDAEWLDPDANRPIKPGTGWLEGNMVGLDLNEDDFSAEDVRRLSSEELSGPPTLYRQTSSSTSFDSTTGSIRSASGKRKNLRVACPASVLVDVQSSQLLCCYQVRFDVVPPTRSSSSGLLRGLPNRCSALTQRNVGPGSARRREFSRVTSEGRGPPEVRGQGGGGGGGSTASAETGREREKWAASPGSSDDASSRFFLY